MGTRSLAINLQMNINLRYSQTVFQGTFGLIKRTFGRIVHFLVVTYCEILNGKDPGGMLVRNFELNPKGDRSGRGPSFF